MRTNVMRLINSGEEANVVLALQLIASGGGMHPDLADALGKVKISKTVLETTDEAFLPYTKKVTLAENKLTALPKKLFRCLNLESLNIGRNEFSALPEAIGVWEKMRAFQCYANKLTTLPDSIAKWQDLTLMHLADNQMQSLPPALYSCRKLNRLHRYQNPIEYISDEIMNLANLHEFSAREQYMPKRIRVSEATSYFLQNISTTDFFRR